MKPIEDHVETRLANPDFRNSLMYDGVVSIVEPKIIAKNVIWQQNSAFYGQKPLQAEDLPEWGLKNSAFGDRITIFVLLCGDHANIQRECLAGIKKSINPAQTDLRVAEVGVSEEITALVKEMKPTVRYVFNRASGKFKIMREMLWDPDSPIKTPYFVWFDDNSFVRDAGWLKKVSAVMKKQTLPVSMYGPRMIYSPGADEFIRFADWSEKGKWFNGRMWQNKNGVATPNGDCVHYCGTWFFVMRTEDMRRCDIPDVRLAHKYGDIAVGAQLHQNDCLIKDLNSDKKLVYTPSSGHGVQREKPPTLPW